MNKSARKNLPADHATDCRKEICENLRERKNNPADHANDSRKKICENLREEFARRSRR